MNIRPHFKVLNCKTLETNLMLNLWAGGDKVPGLGKGI